MKRTDVETPIDQIGLIEVNPDDGQTELDTELELFMLRSLFKNSCAQLYNDIQIKLYKISQIIENHRRKNKVVPREVLQRKMDIESLLDESIRLKYAGGLDDVYLPLVYDNYSRIYDQLDVLIDRWRQLRIGATRHSLSQKNQAIKF